MMKEFDLYEPMRQWLHIYLNDKYRNWEIITEDTHSERLDRALRRNNIILDIATGIDIKIDVLGIVRKNKNFKLFFIEAKKTSLTLKDLGQLWAYFKLIDPEEAYLLSSSDLGTLNKLMNVYKREDLLDFGNNKLIKKMKIGIWNNDTKSPEMSSLIPKI